MMRNVSLKPPKDGRRLKRAEAEAIFAGKTKKTESFQVLNSPRVI